MIYTYYGDEKIDLTDGTEKAFTAGLIVSGDGNAKEAQCQVRGGSIIWLADNGHPDPATDKGFIHADGDIFRIVGETNIGQFKAKKVADNPILIVMYGR